MYRDLRDQAKVFDGLIATSPASVAITHDRTSEVGDAELVSGNYFSVLGIRTCSGTVADTRRRWRARRQPGGGAELPLLDCASGRGPAPGGTDDRPERTYFRGDRHCAAKLPERGVGRDAGCVCPHVNARCSDSGQRQAVSGPHRPLDERHRTVARGGDNCGRRRQV